jgi:hypothetical protein
MEYLKVTSPVYFKNQDFLPKELKILPRKKPFKAIGN